MKVPIQVTVNGQSRQAEVEPRMLLVQFLRDELGLTGMLSNARVSRVFHETWCVR